MGPMASPQTITIISNARLLSVSKPDSAPAMPALPKYAVGLFDSKNGPGPRKRKRLTHLTPEEKIMRRKLKNRVAAQTARDRKKMKLETLEETILKVQSQARELLNVNMQLLERAENLENENKMLREKLGIKSCGGANVVTNQKHNLQRIKTEFDETLLSAEAEMNQPDVQINIPDSILSPDESSADENDVGGNNTSTSRKRSATTASHRDEKRQRRHNNPSPCESDQVASVEVSQVVRGEEGVLVAGGNHGNDSGCGGSSERASPVPAAGFHNPASVDPLSAQPPRPNIGNQVPQATGDPTSPPAICLTPPDASSQQEQGSGSGVIVSQPITEGCDVTNTDELFGLLDEIADDYDANRDSSGLNTEGSTPMNTGVTCSASLPPTSIQVDHIYSKPPRKPMMKVQLSTRKTKLIKQTPSMTSSPLIKVDLNSLATSPMTPSTPSSLDVSNLLKQVINSTQSSDPSSSDVINTPIMTSQGDSSSYEDKIMLCDVKQEPDFTDDLFRSLTPSPDSIFETDIEDFLRCNFSPASVASSDNSSPIDVFSSLEFGDDSLPVDLFPQLA